MVTRVKGRTVSSYRLRVCIEDDQRDPRFTQHWKEPEEDEGSFACASRGIAIFGRQIRTRDSERAFDPPPCKPSAHVARYSASIGRDLLRGKRC